MPDTNDGCGTANGRREEATFAAMQHERAASGTDLVALGLDGKPVTAKAALVPDRGLDSFGDARPRKRRTRTQAGGVVNIGHAIAARAPRP